MTQDEARRASAAMLAGLRGICGRRHVLTGRSAMARFVRGYRYGRGQAIAVVRPGSLVEQWRVLETCLRGGAAIIMQGANTGLTGGSTPDAQGYGRPVVIVNGMRLQAIHLLAGGRQVLCLPGATLHRLERILRKVGREPHSLIGSSCFGASVLGGIANNSGGALVRRGPAYTELALFARLERDGSLSLVNHLGIALGDDAETILRRLDAGDFTASDLCDDDGRRASDHDYARHVRDIDADTPARFNADPRCLFEASGCAGRLALFAARLDTFPMASRTATFLIGSNDPDELADCRRSILADFPDLPDSAEYMHRDTWNFARCYGRDMVATIRTVGVDCLPMLFAAKSWLDDKAVFSSDRMLQRLSRLLPNPAPARLQAIADTHRHLLIVKASDAGVHAMRAFIARRFPSIGGAALECSPAEAERASLLRFVTAGAAQRFLLARNDEAAAIVALDYALPRNRLDWHMALPASLKAMVAADLHYGHFLCHVFHADVVVRPGCDPDRVKEALLTWLDDMGAEYPAEHNVGHQYRAKPALAAFYRSLDPMNRLNPGIGMTSRQPDWD